jgi:preprotein translocase subunit SecG
MISRRLPRKCVLGGSAFAAVVAPPSATLGHWLFHSLAAKTRAMITVILVIHIMLAVALTGVIMVQKSEGGALGMGGGGGMSGFMTGRSAANLLTRTTAILAACFFATSIALALISSHQHTATSVIDNGAPAPAAPAGPLGTTPSTAPGTPAQTAPAAPATPAAPLAK